MSSSLKYKRTAESFAQGSPVFLVYTRNQSSIVHYAHELLQYSEGGRCLWHWVKRCFLLSRGHAPISPSNETSKEIQSPAKASEGIVTTQRSVNARQLILPLHFTTAKMVSHSASQRYLSTRGGSYDVRCSILPPAHGVAYHHIAQTINTGLLALELTLRR